MYKIVVNFFSSNNFSNALFAEIYWRRLAQHLTWDNDSNSLKENPKKLLFWFFSSNSFRDLLAQVGAAFEWCLILYACDLKEQYQKSKKMYKKLL